MKTNTMPRLLEATYIMRRDDVLRDAALIEDSERSPIISFTYRDRFGLPASGPSKEAVKAAARLLGADDTPGEHVLSEHLIVIIDDHGNTVRIIES